MGGGDLWNMFQSIGSAANIQTSLAYKQEYYCLTNMSDANDKYNNEVVRLFSKKLSPKSKKLYIQ